MNLYRCLIPTVPLRTEWIKHEKNKTVEGWLCKTSPKPVGPDDSPFLKAYCVLDLEKMEMLLCGKNDGKVVERIALDDRLCHIETSLTNKIDQNRFHPMGDKSLVDDL